MCETPDGVKRGIDENERANLRPYGLLMVATAEVEWLRAQLAAADLRIIELEAALRQNICPECERIDEEDAELPAGGDG